MKTIFPVKQEEADKARDIESRILKLHPASGVLFVSVTVEAGQSPVYRVFVGCQRRFEEDAVSSLVRETLREDLENGLRLELKVHRGVSRDDLLQSLLEAVDLR